MDYFYRYIMTPTEFQSWKVDVIQATGLARDALHIYFGITLFLIARFIFGDRPSSGPLAWAIVALFAVFGEMLDYNGKGGVFALFSEDVHRHDIVNTLFSPTILLLFGKIIFAHKRERNLPLPDQIGDQSLK